MNRGHKEQTGRHAWQRFYPHDRDIFYRQCNHNLHEDSIQYKYVHQAFSQIKGYFNYTLVFSRYRTLNMQPVPLNKDHLLDNTFSLCRGPVIAANLCFRFSHFNLKWYSIEPASFRIPPSSSTYEASIAALSLYLPKIKICS